MNIRMSVHSSFTIGPHKYRKGAWDDGVATGNVSREKRRESERI